ncbi:helix-turn-helix domain-containing protein [Bifidobacterium aquikefiricola]|uniref:AraC family transcriptional regulator n=1 Tax=Bifidobacterium aquikefiricola TaxID=3059038 RepID=A0AB39U718_9BIFI
MEHSLFFGVKDNHAMDQLAFSYCGISQTEAGHAYGPSLNSAWVFHVVLRGQGKVSTEDFTYKLGAGDGFLVRPQSSTRYSSSASDPWGYLWFGVQGDLVGKYLNVIGMRSEQTVFTVKNVYPFLSILSRCLKYTSGSISDELELNALSLSFLSSFARELSTTEHEPIATAHNELVREAVHVIIHEWRPGITAAWVANRVNVDRSHLSRVFHRDTGMTIKAYIEHIRLSRAHDLLGMTEMSVADVAQECGYASVEALTRNFHESQGFSPSEFRKANTGVLNNLGVGIDFLSAAFSLPPSH